MILTFPWPPKELSPNARVHWAKKATFVTNYKLLCWKYCCVGGLKPIDAPAALITITFNPPDRRKRDLDNMLSSFKAGLDAISIRTKIDDSNFQLVITKGVPIKGGAVEVEIQPAIKPVKVAA